ncbi:alpha/beta fold hydrolase [Rhodococcus sp. NPDC003318]|uniref:alpha/beta fold hydrolase n=1 Tax=Rhodococcus sp. NPDC003318 TaxID=3364503 RepID=UPI00368D98D5
MSHSINGSVAHRPAVATTVRNGDVELAVFEQGNPAGPTLVLVHGWPDTHRLWDHVVPLLVDRFRVITYDTRGAGRSTSPTAVADYKLELLASDLLTVVDAVGPGDPVHLLAHDWGSLESWEAVCSPRAQGRIASFTSTSGWCFDHLGQWMWRNLRQPTPSGVGKVLAQWAASFYALLFHIPVVPEVVVGRLIAPRWPRFLALFDRMDPALALPAATIGRDAANGLKRYRANTGDRILRPRQRRTAVPVQLLVNTRDKAVLPYAFEETGRWASDLRCSDVPAGHWSPLSHAGDVARLTAAFVLDVVARSGGDGATATA